MCELMGMACAMPTDARFYFAGLAARGGATDCHIDGWGIAFLDRKSCRVFIDDQPSSMSSLAQHIAREPIRSRNTIAHVRKATVGKACIENCHPFVRQLWGRNWAFAHQGSVHGYTKDLDELFRPVGTTDSEFAFCSLLQDLHKAFGNREPACEEIFECVAQSIGSITEYGSFNFLLSNGELMFAHCSTHLQYSTRRWPFAQSRLVDIALTQDPDDSLSRNNVISVFSTRPLTDTEVWTPMSPGDLHVFEAGRIAASTHIPVPAHIAERARRQRTPRPHFT
jgi:predicted glutamine amidotransferase